PAGGSGSDGDRESRAPRRESRSEASNEGGDVESVSFDDSFDAELAGELGDLGPGSERRGGGGGGRRRHR
ncbi:MAG: hypothetical protein VW685_03085, partial [Ilumatobacter sp.]